MGGISINRPGFMKAEGELSEPKSMSSKKFLLPVIPLRKPTGAEKQPGIGMGDMKMSKFGQ
jgi:hypothetical protein